MPELAETQLETPAPAAEPVARIEDDDDEDSDDTIPELEDAGMYKRDAFPSFHFISFDVRTSVIRVKTTSDGSCVVHIFFFLQMGILLCLTDHFVSISLELVMNQTSRISSPWGHRFATVVCEMSGAFWIFLMSGVHNLWTGEENFKIEKWLQSLT